MLINFKLNDQNMSIPRVQMQQMQHNDDSLANPCTRESLFEELRQLEIKGRDIISLHLDPKRTKIVKNLEEAEAKVPPKLGKIRVLKRSLAKVSEESGSIDEAMDMCLTQWRSVIQSLNITTQSN